MSFPTTWIEQTYLPSIKCKALFIYQNTFLCLLVFKDLKLTMCILLMPKTTDNIFCRLFKLWKIKLFYPFNRNSITCLWDIFTRKINQFRLQLESKMIILFICVTRFSKTIGRPKEKEKKNCRKLFIDVIAPTFIKVKTITISRKRNFSNIRRN
jgi:membrane-bound metal-dependent hydrolase YbcI (DUF457 family)